MSVVEFEQRVTIEPAYDLRSEGRGAHGATLRMVLAGPLGATQFVLYTNWYLPGFLEDLKAKGAVPEVLTRPIPADLGYHWRTEPYEGCYHRDDCDILGEGGCYYDGSGLNAERVFGLLLTGGSDAVWAELRSYYDELARGQS